MSENQGDVLIVGGGIVGATLALLLGEAGWRVHGFDAAPAPDGLDSVGTGAPSLRVSALTAASRRLLESLAVWPALQARRVASYRGMQVWDGEGSGEIRFDAAEVGSDALGHIVENDLLLAALYQRFEGLANVTWHFGVRLDSYQRLADHATITLDNGERWQAPLVVGADGPRSALRGLAGIAVSQRDTGQSAVVTSVRTQVGHGDIARQVFLETGPLAFLPLCIEAPSIEKHDHHCSIVWSTTPGEAQRLTGLGESAQGRAQLGHELAQAIEGRLGEVEVLDVAPHFPIAQRHARRYVDSGLALIGDAAHSLHPLAGQGVNLGLMDAAVLAEEWIRAHQRGADPADPRILARYERRRRSDNSAMLAAMQGFQGLFGSRQPALKLVRNWGLGRVDRLMPVKRLLIRQALGEYGDLPERCR